MFPRSSLFTLAILVFFPFFFIFSNVLGDGLEWAQRGLSYLGSVPSNLCIKCSKVFLIFSKALMDPFDQVQVLVPGFIDARPILALINTSISCLAFSRDLQTYIKQTRHANHQMASTSADRTKIPRMIIIVMVALFNSRLYAQLTDVLCLLIVLLLGLRAPLIE